MIDAASIAPRRTPSRRGVQLAMKRRFARCAGDLLQHLLIPTANIVRSAEILRLSSFFLAPLVAL